MDYEKKYKEAVNKIRDLLDDGEKNGFTIVTYKTDLESIFPELTGSEDEKVRKEIVEYLKKNLRLEWATWLEKQGKSSDQIHYWTEEEIEPIISDYLRGAEHYGGMIGRLRCLKPKSLENQGEQKQKINNFDVLPGLYKCVHRMFDGTPDGRLLFEVGNVYKCLSKHDRAEFEVSYGHSVYLEDPVVCKHFIPFEKQDEVESDNDDIEVEEKGIRKASNKIEDEKQCKQKPQRMISAEAKEAMYAKTADTVEPKFKVKYAGSEYNVLDIKDIAGVAFYVIEDEPNHIDYVKAENCEIIDGYAIKENGSPYPTKSAVFFGAKNPTWSKEDDVMIYKLLAVVELYYDRDGDDLDKQSCIDWLKALKQRCAWKPSDEQLEALKNAIHIKPFKNPSDSILWRLYEQLKKLKG